MARYLDESEKTLWLKVVDTITPLRKPDAPEFWDKKDSSKEKIKTAILQKKAPINISQSDAVQNQCGPSRADLEAALNKPIPKIIAKQKRTIFYTPDTGNKNPHNGLDGQWEKRFTKGTIIPDISIDLHGAGLQSAYDRLDGTLEQARAQKLRIILLVTGRQRSYDRASGEGRGGIRAVISDWLSASRHSDMIASVRNAHPRHGGAGALYIILRK